MFSAELLKQWIKCSSVPIREFILVDLWASLTDKFVYVNPSGNPTQNDFHAYRARAQTLIRDAVETECEILSEVTILDLVEGRFVNGSRDKVLSLPDPQIFQQSMLEKRQHEDEKTDLTNTVRLLFCRGFATECAKYMPHTRTLICGSQNSTLSTESSAGMTFKPPLNTDVIPDFQTAKVLLR